MDKELSRKNLNDFYKTHIAGEGVDCINDNMPYNAFTIFSPENKFEAKSICLTVSCEKNSSVLMLIKCEDIVKVLGTSAFNSDNTYFTLENGQLKFEYNNIRVVIEKNKNSNADA